MTRAGMTDKIMGKRGFTGGIRMFDNPGRQQFGGGCPGEGELFAVAAWAITFQDGYLGGVLLFLATLGNITIMLFVNMLFPLLFQGAAAGMVCPAFR